MQKNSLRKEFLQKRKALSDDLYFELSQKIADQFFFNFHSKLLNTKYLHVFLPIEKNKEPNTNFILKIVFQRFKKLEIVVPKTDFSQNTLQHFLIEEGTIFHENKYGIPEPDSELQIPENELDIVLVPLLGFDKKGHRIGYGGGFYDRFLSKTKPECIKIGLSFFEPHDIEIAAEPTDIALDYCITPNKIWSFSDQNS